MHISLNTSLSYQNSQKTNIQTCPILKKQHCLKEFVLPSYAQCVSFRSNITHKNELNFKSSNIASIPDEHISLEQSAQMIKEKINKQLMHYSEDDIKNTISEVMQKNPGITRERVLKTLSILSSFSNYESFSQINAHLKEEGFNNIYHSNELTLNNIALYLSKKGIIKHNQDTADGKTALFIDRNTIEHLKNLKLKNPTEFANLKEEIKADKVRPILLDGWEAKTHNGYKSFNVVGAWGNLTETVSDIIQSEENIGKKSIYLNYLYDDLVNLFGNNFDFDIIRNSAGNNVTEEIIANRLNSPSISKEQIVDNITYFQNCILDGRNEITCTELQDIIGDFLINTITVYTPRRMAKEFKELHEKINKQISTFKKNPQDALFITPIKYKSFDLANYQYSRVNNIPLSQYAYLDESREVIETPTNKDNTFVFCDDFSGSGASLLYEQLMYQNLKKDNQDNHMIFAPLVYTELAQNNIEDEIKQVKSDINYEYEDEYGYKKDESYTQSNYAQDSFIGNKLINSYNETLSKLSEEKLKIFQKILKSSYGQALISIGFMHIIPDNCSTLASNILEELLTTFKR